MSPGLHIKLGVFFRLFTLLEDDCHELDLAHTLHGVQAGPTYERYITALRKKRESEEEVNILRDHIQRLEQLVTLAAITLPNPAANTQYRNFCTVVATNKQRVQELVV